MGCSVSGAAAATAVFVAHAEAIRLGSSSSASASGSGTTSSHSSAANSFHRMSTDAVATVASFDDGEVVTSLSGKIRGIKAADGLGADLVQNLPLQLPGHHRHFAPAAAHKPPWQLETQRDAEEPAGEPPRQRATHAPDPQRRPPERMSFDEARQQQERIGRRLSELQAQQEALQAEAKQREEELLRQQQLLLQQAEALRLQHAAAAAAAAAAAEAEAADARSALVCGAPGAGPFQTSMAQSAPCNLAPKALRQQMLALRRNGSGVSLAPQDPESPTYADAAGLRVLGRSPPVTFGVRRGGGMGMGGGGAGGVRGPRGGGRLRERRGGLHGSFGDLQAALPTEAEALSIVSTRAAGLKHIGFGPFKRENQDEFFIQVGHYGGQPGANLFCVFDGHGPYGKDAAAASRQLLPTLLDKELKSFYKRNPGAAHSEMAEATRSAVDVLMNEVFAETERSLGLSGVNLTFSGTTASVAYQLGNRLWVASAGDSRAILCSCAAPGSTKLIARPLTLDHRPRRLSERLRVEAAGGRVQPKQLPSGRLVGEPRVWLQQVAAPGLLLSRSLGDLMAATVGCTSEPEISYVTLEPERDQFVVLASDGVWDVLTNEQVCDIVAESPDPHVACRRVLDSALYEWEEKMSADNITVLVVELDWRWVVQDLPLGAGGGSEAAVAVPMMHESGKHALISGDHLPAIQEGHCPGDGDAAGAAGW
ncbi:hypothetical protein MNEG_8356 [Monoraphidium neglectum]|uniref:protein-serine/threonine phosphatase n=1 Tax=Monoraphidium neglectum TaxID=145388 RepID=A0A0D2MZT2_9CHLO|nr:hypothetical protein MNEG_8356 [Monoraphidium neglectum]KIY99605.1 hypothetical protein MNEG_8356 [Monoraphidium neglectum]|eukprot:XP_013898625.1 hypothetical protein MNEG_8356 [Monoraphidium neglectum]